MPAMAQKKAWEEEYKAKRLVGGNKPALSLRVFAKWLKKQRKAEGLIENPGFAFQGISVLDLGSGEGKNALYMAERGAHVTGIEIAENAVAVSRERAGQKSRELRLAGGSLEYKAGSIGSPFSVKDASVDLVLDVTSSNSLSTPEREVYLSESSRVLKQGGYMFVRALCRDSDDNAKQLLIDNPGPEEGTYVMPETGIVERVFTEKEIRDLYGKYFNILRLEKEFHYTKMSGRSYKRAFWIMYLSK